MPYKISWHSSTTMLVELLGDISPDDVKMMTNESFALVETASERIDAIVDQSQATSLPLSLKTLLNSIPRNHSPLQGMTILLIPKMNQMTLLPCDPKNYWKKANKYSGSRHLEMKYIGLMRCN